MIRRATESDCQGIVDLISANLDRLLPRTVDDVRNLLEGFWVAVIDGTIVGCVCLEVYSQKIAEVRSLVVRQGFREQGIGQELVRVAVAAARERGVPEILVVTSTPRFFEKLDFGPCLNEKYALFWRGD